MERRKVQCIICKCGFTIAGCVVPMCYEDAEWMRSVRLYSKKGYTIEIRDAVDSRLHSCECNKTNQLNLI